MTIYCFGNTIDSGDSIPVQLIPILRNEFPAASVMHLDPSENFMPEHASVVIDSVEGATTVQMFSDIDAFVITKSVSVHDYDLGLHLQLLKKLHKLPKIHIIAVPRYSSITQVKNEVVALLHSILHEEGK